MESTFRRRKLGVIQYLIIVSILVLMESTFRQPRPSPYRTSLSVSILVLMESTFRHLFISLSLFTIPCFNPCFNGINIQTHCLDCVDSSPEVFQSLF